MRGTERARPRAYAAAIAGVALAIWLNAILWPWLTPTPSLVFLPAVIIAASYGGLGPGLAATVLSVVTLAYGFMPPYWSLKVDGADVIRLCVFASAAIATTVVVDRRRRAEDDASRVLLECERRVLEKTMELNDANRALGAESRERSRLAHELLSTQEAERRRLAAQLHDGVGDRLARIEEELIRPLAHANEWTVRGATLGRHLAVLRAQVRDLSLDLRPPILDEAGLIAALHWQIEQHYARTTQQAMLRYSAQVDRFPEAVESALFRVVQEVLYVVGKSRNPVGARIELNVDALGGLQLAITAPDAPFDENSAVVRSIRERVSLLERLSAHRLVGRTVERESANRDERIMNPQ